MFVRFLVVCLSLAFVASASAGSVDEVKALAAQLDQATQTKDKAALERLVADDHFFIRGSGRVGDKADIIGTFSSPTITVTSLKNAEQRLIDLGDTVLVTAKVELAGVESGTAFVENFRSCDVWAKRKGAWQVVYTQITMLKTS